MIFDENVWWKAQIHSTSKKISKAIEILRWVKPFVSEDTTNTMYNSLELPYLDYCNKSLLDKIQKLQNRAPRVITGDTYDIRSTDI